MSRLAPTAWSTVLVAVLVLAAHVEVLMVAAVVLVVQAQMAAAPPPADARGRAVPTPKAVATVVAGVVATVLTVRPQWLHGAEGTRAGEIGVLASGTVAGVLPAVAAGVFLSLLAQMLRREGRRDLVVSTGYAVAVTTFAALTVGWISAASAFGGREVVAVGASSMVVALLVWCLPIDRWICGCLAVSAGAAGGVAATLVLDGFLLPLFGVVIGMAVGLFAVLGQVLGRAWGEGRRHAASGWGFPGALSVALAAPVVHLGGQLASRF